jgi:hypothetical protein
MKSYCLFIYAACTLIICGCSKQQPPSDVKVETEVSKITLEDLDNRLRNLEIEDLYKNFETIAYLPVSEKKFATIKSSIGTVVFLIDDIKPYANGSNLKLIIGNPLYASLSDVKFKIDYGELDKENMPIDESQKTKDVSLLKPLKQGRWNKEEVILGGILPEKLGYIRIHDFDFRSITLNK